MHYGIATIFLTINPADIHSPIFLRFAGQKIDLNSITKDHFPNRSTREQLLINDPVAAAKFPNCIFSNVIDHLLEFLVILCYARVLLHCRISGRYGLNDF